MLDRRMIPAALSSRFLAHETPAFEVIREAGDLRLWKSTVRRADFQGAPLQSVHFHITDGDEIDATHMSRIDRAVSSFELLVRRADCREAAGALKRPHPMKANG